MKKIIISILSFLLFFTLLSCENKNNSDDSINDDANNTELIDDDKKTDNKLDISSIVSSYDIEDKIEFPLKTSIKKIEYPKDLKLEEIKMIENINNIDDFVKAVDIHIFNSLNDEDKMEYYYFKLSDELLIDVKKDVKGFIADAFQAALIGHNFYFGYDDSKIDEGLLGVRCYFVSNYADYNPAVDNTTKVLNYEFYKNSLSDKINTLKIIDLPLFKENNGFVEVFNSDQLVFACENNYFPYASITSDAYKFLSKALEILSRIIRVDMGEYEIYKSIYQYVIQTNIYDNKTLLDDRLQNRTNRVFFLEGSMIDETSVCDGLAKEVVFLSRLMGIEAYHIGARNEDGGHAYLYVKIGNTYYLSCATYCLESFPIRDKFQAYTTMNYFLTDYDTNERKWKFDSKSLTDIGSKIKETETFDYWEETKVSISGKEYNFKPQTKEDAIYLLIDAYKVYLKTGKVVEIELCGSYDILKSAYDEFLEFYPNLVFLSSGTFNSNRLQTYLFGVEK